MCELPFQMIAKLLIELSIAELSAQVSSVPADIQLADGMYRERKRQGAFKSSTQLIRFFGKKSEQVREICFKQHCRHLGFQLFCTCNFYFPIQRVIFSLKSSRRRIGRVNA